MTAAFVAAIALSGAANAPPNAPAPAHPATPANSALVNAVAPTFRELADDAARALTTRWYDGAGRWRTCLDPSCGAGNVDWGSDSLTGVLYERWLVTHDAGLVPVFRALLDTEPRYGDCRRPRCRSWSDVPMWDAVAAIRTYDVTGDAAALRNAEAAYDHVARSDVFARGACPEIDYQRPRAESDGLKTLETDANATLAAALLAERTGLAQSADVARRAEYLNGAKRRYDAVRARFLNGDVPLYTVYVFDDGKTCRALPHRFFASVNGVMIEAGLTLAHLTGEARYARDARATAHAVRALDDDRGIFTDLQAENDIVEPLVLAMLLLAREGDAFAREWIVRNAGAAAHARRAEDGAYGRFFDGPPPSGAVTAWQTNGGLAIEIAAASLAPDQRVEADDSWSRAESHDVALTTLPATLPFTGSGVALYGTLGERCCEPGRTRVLIDGRETFDATGIWQNKSSAGRALRDTVLFAWRWPASGTHELRFEAGAPNAKEGGAFLDIRRATILR